MSAMGPCVHLTTCLPMKHTLVGHVPSNNIHHHIRMGACEGKEKVENGSQKYSACMNK